MSWDQVDQTHLVQELSTPIPWRSSHHLSLPLLASLLPKLSSLQVVGEYLEDCQPDC